MIVHEQKFGTMGGNQFGKFFRVVTFGESHGPYIGVVIDGVKANIPLDISEIAYELHRRKPGQSTYVTQRKESDTPQIISGIYNGRTTGTPICILIKNEDARPKDYQSLEKILRPGHAAFTYLQKYGIYDYRGGGRASGRETAARVAAGAIAKQLLKKYGIKITGFVRQIGSIRAKKIEINYIEQNPLRCPDPETAEEMANFLRNIQDEGDSVGGIVEIWIDGVPAGLGEPVFEKLEADFAAALLSIGAVKGVEFGDGFLFAEMRGSNANDEWAFDAKHRRFYTKTNHAGGIIAGISTGERIVIRIAVKPPSSIRKPQQSVTISGEPVTFQTHGRHDPCICPRIVPVAEAMLALVLIDHLLMQEQRSQRYSVEYNKDLVDTQLLLLIALRMHMEREGKIDPEINAELLETVHQHFKISKHQISNYLNTLFNEQS